MKKTAKRIITGILAVTTVASSAVLFTGCGSSPKEKASALVSAVESKIEEKKQNTLDLSKFNEEVVNKKLYTVEFYPDSVNNGVSASFYLKINSPIEIDGFTFTKVKDEEDNGMGLMMSDWEITKDGSKCPDCRIFTNWGGFDNPNTFELSSNVEQSLAEVDDTKFTFLPAKAKKYEVEIPAALTADESKERADEIQKLIEANTDMEYYKEKSTKLEGIYYFKGNPGEECLRAIYSYNFWEGIDSTEEQIMYFYVDGTYPFMDGDELTVVKWAQQEGEADVFHQIFPNLHGMLVVAVEGTVYKLHLWDFFIYKEL